MADAVCLCGWSMWVPDEYAGRKAHCPKCRQLVRVGVVPEPEPPPESEPPKVKLWPCPDCGALTNPKALACPGCGRPTTKGLELVDARLAKAARPAWAQSQPRPQPAPSVTGDRIAIMLGLLFALVMGVLIAGQNRDAGAQPRPARVATTPSTPTRTNTPARPARSGVVGLGEIGYLRHDDPDPKLNIFLVPRDEDWDKFHNAVLAEDHNLIGAMLVVDRLYRIPNGTKVKVVKTDWFSARVEVQEGRHAGVRGWVARERIYRN